MAVMSGTNCPDIFFAWDASNWQTLVLHIFARKDCFTNNIQEQSGWPAIPSMQIQRCQPKNSTACLECGCTWIQASSGRNPTESPLCPCKTDGSPCRCSLLRRSAVPQRLICAWIDQLAIADMMGWCVIAACCDCVWFIYNCPSVQHLKIVSCNVSMKEKWKRLHYNQFAAGTAYVSDIMGASYIKIAFLHMTVRHIRVSESRIWKLQTVFCSCPLTATSVCAGVLPPCDRGKLGKKSLFRKRPPLLIRAQLNSSHKRSMRAAGKWKHK